MIKYSAVTTINSLPSCSKLACLTIFHPLPDFTSRDGTYFMSRALKGLQGKGRLLSLLVNNWLTVTAS